MAADQDIFFDAKVSVFKLNDGSSLQDLSAYAKSVRGLPGSFKVNDVTTFGKVGEVPGPSIFIAHFTVDFLFNMITTTGVHTLLGTIFSTKVARAFEYYPGGTTTGNAKISGSAFLPIYNITSEAGDFVLAHAEFHTTNGITLGTA